MILCEQPHQCVSGLPFLVQARALLRLKVLPQPLEERVAHLAGRALGAVLDFGKQLRLHPDALVRGLLGVGLGLSDQRRQPLSQIGGGGLVEAVVDLAGVDQVLALAAADMEAVPVVAVEAAPAILSLSRWAQVFFTRLRLRPET
jgi:hypothetical protein